MCQGGRSCIVEPGTYVVINISTGVRTYDVVVREPSNPPVVMGNTISWQDNGWYQVQVQGDVESDVCQGGTSCEVEPNTYVVINLTTGERFYDVVVTGDSAAQDSVLDILVAAGEFSSLIAAFEVHGIEELLDDDAASLTLFAPTDDAINALGQEAIDVLLNDPGTLRDALQFHIIAGTGFRTNEFEQVLGNVIESGNGGALIVSDSGEGLSVNGVNIVVADILAENGVIHVIDAVLIP